MYRKILRAEGPGIADQTHSDEVNISTPDEFQVSGCYFARRVRFNGSSTLHCSDCVFCGPVLVYAERCTFTRCMFTWGVQTGNDCGVLVFEDCIVDGETEDASIGGMFAERLRVEMTNCAWKPFYVFTALRRPPPEVAVDGVESQEHDRLWIVGYGDSDSE